MIVVVRFAGALVLAISVVLAVALFWRAGSMLLAPAVTADTWHNPFCNALAYVVPWNAASNSPSIHALSDRYFLALRANGKMDVAGSVTLITSTDAYSVPIKRTALRRKADGGTAYVEPMLVSFDTPVGVRFAYIDQIGIDGAAPATCPSVVQTVKPFADDPAHPFDAPSLGTDTVAIPATYREPLPVRKCGNVYSDPEVIWNASLSGRYGNQPRSILVHVYIDSNGRVTDAKLERSSGVDALDAAALSGVQQAQFKPAEFLCTRVVSEMSIKMNYTP